MFIGHFGAGLAAKAADEKPSLGTFFIAAQFLDLLWPVLLLTGLERVEIDPGNTAVTPLDFVSYPISHSLLWVVGWSILFGVFYYLIKRRFKSSLLLGALVMSHWFLDLIVHRPDLPLTPWGTDRVGLGLWNAPLATVLVEGAIFTISIWLYIRSTRAVNKTGTFAMWGMFVFLAAVYVANLLGPPPPSPAPIPYLGMAMWLIALWAFWVDRNRESLHSRAAKPFQRELRSAAQPN